MCGSFRVREELALQEHLPGMQARVHKLPVIVDECLVGRAAKVGGDGHAEVGTDLQPLEPEKKQPTVDVVEIAHGDTEDLNAEAKARFDVLLDAMKIMDRETPVLEAAAV